jgi:single-strand DNA-binding protein
MNTITLLGRATSQIECKQTQAGKSVVSFSLAVKRPFTKDTTDFFNIVAWDKTAETIAKYVNKGNLIGIRGYLQNRSWEDKNGNKRYATEIVAEEVDFCEARNTAQGTEAPSPTNYIPDAYKAPQNANFEGVETDPDLPF